MTSPISGRVGLRLVDPGNFVHTTDTTGIVGITQLQPIPVVITLPEDNIPSVLDKLNVVPNLDLQQLFQVISATLRCTSASDAPHRSLAWRNSAFGPRHHDHILTPVANFSSPAPVLQSSW
jgi:hypothetical protein